MMKYMFFVEHRFITEFPHGCNLTTVHWILIEADWPSGLLDSLLEALRRLDRFLAGECHEVHDSIAEGVDGQNLFIVLQGMGKYIGNAVQCAIGERTPLQDWFSSLPAETCCRLLSCLRSFSGLRTLCNSALKHGSSPLAWDGMLLLPGTVLIDWGALFRRHHATSLVDADWGTVEHLLRVCKDVGATHCDCAAWLSEAGASGLADILVNTFSGTEVGRLVVGMYGDQLIRRGLPELQSDILRFIRKERSTKEFKEPYEGLSTFAKGMGDEIFADQVHAMQCHLYLGKCVGDVNEWWSRGNANGGRWVDLANSLQIVQLRRGCACVAQLRDKDEGRHFLSLSQPAEKHPFYHFDKLDCVLQKVPFQQVLVDSIALLQKVQTCWLQDLNAKRNQLVSWCPVWWLKEEETPFDDAALLGCLLQNPNYGLLASTAVKLNRSVELLSGLRDVLHADVPRIDAQALRDAARACELAKLTVSVTYACHMCSAEFPKVADPAERRTLVEKTIKAFKGSAKVDLVKEATPILDSICKHMQQN
jgi:hypothetical protein